MQVFDDNNTSNLIHPVESSTDSVRKSQFPMV